MRPINGHSAFASFLTHITSHSRLIHPPRASHVGRVSEGPRLEPPTQGVCQKALALSLPRRRVSEGAQLRPFLGLQPVARLSTRRRPLATVALPPRGLSHAGSAFRSPSFSVFQVFCGFPPHAVLFLCVLCILWFLSPHAVLFCVFCGFLPSHAVFFPCSL